MPHKVSDRPPDMIDHRTLDDTVALLLFIGGERSERQIRLKPVFMGTERTKSASLANKGSVLFFLPGNDVPNKSVLLSVLIGVTST